MGIADWITATGAAVAAITGIVNLGLLLRGKRDKFEIRMGPVSPTYYEESMFHVVSKSDHPIKLRDWGFINERRKFESFLLDFDCGQLHDEHVVQQGKPELEKHGAYYGTGYIRTNNPIGAYALSVGQTRPQVAFSSDTPLSVRLRVRLRLLFRPDYLNY